MEFEASVLSSRVGTTEVLTKVNIIEENILDFQLTIIKLKSPEIFIAKAISLNQLMDMEVFFNALAHFAMGHAVVRDRLHPEWREHSTMVLVTRKNTVNLDELSAGVQITGEHMVTLTLTHLTQTEITSNTTLGTIWADEEINSVKDLLTNNRIVDFDHVPSTLLSCIANDLGDHVLHCHNYM